MPNLHNIELAFFDENNYNIEPDFIPAWFDIDFGKPIDLSLYSLGDLKDKKIIYSSKCIPRTLEYFNFKINNIESISEENFKNNEIYYLDNNGKKIENINFNNYKIEKNNFSNYKQESKNETNEIVHSVNLENLIKNQYNNFFDTQNINNNEIINEIEVLNNNYIEILKTNVQNVYSYIDQSIVDLEVKQNLYIQNITQEITNNLINHFNTQYSKHISLLEKRNINNTINILKS